MGSADGTSIHIDCLASMWGVDMERKGNIKEGGGSKLRGSKNPGKKHCSNLQSNFQHYLRTLYKNQCPRISPRTFFLQFTLVYFHSFVIKPI